MGVIVLWAGTDDHLIWVGPVVLNLEESGLTHLESVIRVTYRGFAIALSSQTLTLIWNRLVSQKGILQITREKKKLKTSWKKITMILLTSTANTLCENGDLNI